MLTPNLIRRCAVGAVVCAALLALDWAQRPPLPSTPSAARSALSSGSVPSAPTLLAQGRGDIPMPPNTPVAHASALLALPASHPASVMAFWFAGSRESGPDVRIAAAQFDRATQRWSAARFVLSRDKGRGRLGFAVRRLGNPVAWLDGQGRVHLFVVATGLGGWAAGRILHLRQDQVEHDFSKLEFRVVGALPLSWLWKTSHLVRAAPLPLADGGMVLPVYFELGIKYPLALRFDAAGEFLGMARMSQRSPLLQPTLLARSATDWLALMRDGGTDKKIKVAQTLDAGQHWQDLPDLALPNPDASIAGLTLPSGALLLAHNPLVEGRSVLELAGSSDGLQWTPLHTLESGARMSEYSYPSLAWADDGLWVSYTNQRRVIAWQRFGLAAPTSTSATPPTAPAQR